MKENVGGSDRLARAVAGPALMAMGYARWGGDRGGLLGLAALVSGALLTETAITRVCPLNELLGVDTSPPPRLPARLPRHRRTTPPVPAALQP